MTFVKIEIDEQNEFDELLHISDDSFGSPDRSRLLPSTGDVAIAAPNNVNIA